MDECKHFFKDLVYVDFEDEKIIGEVKSHRITNEGKILYQVGLANLYVPVTMIHKLTQEQEEEYNELIIKKNFKSKEDCIKEMQNIFK